MKLIAEYPDNLSDDKLAEILHQIITYKDKEAECFFGQIFKVNGLDGAYKHTNKKSITIKILKTNKENTNA
ncbi:MAG: hypothetical protein IJA72_04645 [Clostridia bacterium]|nr:hypothetical protein [Clostridia bacterium]